MQSEVYNTFVVTRDCRLHCIIQTMSHFLNIAEK